MDLLLFLFLSTSGSSTLPWVQKSAFWAVCLLVVNECSGPKHTQWALKTRFGLETVPRCEPNIYESIGRSFRRCAIRGKEGGNVLFNDALNTFYLRLYGVRHMVEDHPESERDNPLPPHGLLFPINSKGSFICSSHRQDCTYHSLCYTSRGALAGTRNSSMGPPHEGSIRRPIAP